MRCSDRRRSWSSRSARCWPASRLPRRGDPRRWPDRACSLAEPRDTSRRPGLDAVGPPGRSVRRPGRTASRPGPPKILVVEDSFTVRELQRSILETAGYAVVTARDGPEALAVLDRDAEIALVITDLEMPGLDGLELTRAIRGNTGARRAARRHRDLAWRRRRTGAGGSRRAPMRTWRSRASISRPCSPPSSGSSAGDGMTALRVLVCEGSRAYAAALRRMLEHDRDITVAAVCATAKEAVNALPLCRAGPGDDGPGPARHGRPGRRRGDHERPAAADPGAARRTSARAATRLRPRWPPGRSTCSLRRTSTCATRPTPPGAAFRQRVRVLSHAHVIRHPRARLRGPAYAHSSRARGASVIGDVRVGWRALGAGCGCSGRCPPITRSRSWSSSTLPPVSRRGSSAG